MSASISGDTFAGSLASTSGGKLASTSGDTLAGILASVSGGTLAGKFTGMFAGGGGAGAPGWPFGITGNGVSARRRKHAEEWTFMDKMARKVT
jgi:hypothetical protein